MNAKWKSTIAFAIIPGTLLLAGCGTENEALTEDWAESPCPLINLTRPCTCSFADGRQICLSSGWSDCECKGQPGPNEPPNAGSVPEPENNDSPVRFDWARNDPGADACGNAAGKYEGSFSGFYYSPDVFDYPVPVFNVKTQEGQPASMRFELVRDANGEKLSVRGGRLDGAALVAFPFTADIEGSFDCATRTFDGRLVNGRYQVAGNSYGFEGPVHGDYDTVARTFVNGDWHVTEPDNELGGGNGKWGATQVQVP